jgi:hypothetical protein
VPATITTAPSHAHNSHSRDLKKDANMIDPLW